MADSWKVHNGDVIRWRFTLHYGDLGSERLAVPDMDALIKAMAVFNANRQLCMDKGYLTAYNEASRFVTDMDSSFIDESQPGHTEKEIEAKIRKLCGNLPTEGTVKQWKAEKEAEKKAAAAKRKKYTPSAPKWKSIKSVRKGTASLVWKKNSKATGYEIYMSTKKSSGYKKIATVKQEDSSWFNKFDEDFFVIQGKIFRELSSKFYFVLCLQYVVRKYFLYRENISFFKALKCILKDSED